MKAALAAVILLASSVSAAQAWFYLKGCGASLCTGDGACVCLDNNTEYGTIEAPMPTWRGGVEDSTHVTEYPDSNALASAELEECPKNCTCFYGIKGKLLRTYCSGVLVPNVSDDTPSCDVTRLVELSEWLGSTAANPFTLPWWTGKVKVSKTTEGIIQELGLEWDAKRDELLNVIRQCKEALEGVK